MGGSGAPLLKIPQVNYNGLLNHRNLLLQQALTSIQVLLDYDEQVLSHYVSDGGSAAVDGGLPAAIAAAAPLIETASDWYPVLLLANERGYDVSVNGMIDLVKKHAIGTQLPTRGALTNNRFYPYDLTGELRGNDRFPNWQPNGCRYGHFRHYMEIAYAASPHL